MPVYERKVFQCLAVVKTGSGGSQVELMEVIRHRRAVRDFTETRLERSTVQSLLDTAILAPSAMNLQPWAFAVLLDPERINRYATRARTWLLENFSQTSHDQSLRKVLEDPKHVLFYHAPALVLVLATSSDAQAKEDCCLAAENFMLAARAQGLGTCWIGLARPWLNLPSIKTELKIPENSHVVAPIVLGHPKAWPESHGRNAATIYWLG
jgi:nitroreductase